MGAPDSAPPEDDAGRDAAIEAGDDAGPPAAIRLVLAPNADFAESSAFGFFDRPFPLDTRRAPDGRPSLAGFPNPRRLSLVAAVTALAEQETDGFSPAAAIWLRFTGPLSPDGFPTPEESVGDDSAIVLVNVDAGSPNRGARTPVIVAQPTRDELMRPSHLLQVRPVSGFNLEERTLHALVVRRNIGSGDRDRALDVDPVLASLVAGDTPDAADGPRLVELFAPLRAWLSEEGIDADEVVGATVFRTGDVTSRLYRMVEAVREEPAREPIWSAPTWGPWRSRSCHAFSSRVDR